MDLQLFSWLSIRTRLGATFYDTDIDQSVESFKNVGVIDPLRHGDFSNPDNWGALPRAGGGLTFSLPNSYNLFGLATLTQGSASVDFDWYRTYLHLPPLYQNIFKAEYDEENRFMANNYDLSANFNAKVAPRGLEKSFGITFADSLRSSWRESLKVTDTSEEIPLTEDMLDDPAIREKLPEIMENGGHIKKNSLHTGAETYQSIYNRLTIRPEWMLGENRDNLLAIGGSYIFDNGNPDIGADHGFGLDLFYGYYGTGKTSWSIGLTPSYMFESRKVTVPLELQIAPHSWRSFGGRFLFGLSYAYQPGRDMGTIVEPEKQSKASPNISTQTTVSNSVNPMHNVSVFAGFKFSPPFGKKKK
jgi:hypothetical protein